VKKIAEEYGTQDLIVVFGLNQPATLRIMAQTFHDGDPSYAGPLAGVALGLKSYHILELKALIPANAWEEQMGMHELEIEDEVLENICEIMKDTRHE
jgi:glycine reductase